jgi:peptidoglycan/xylan/chitin deacetylase (PgdA/CDA1 family)
MSKLFIITYHRISDHTTDSGYKNIISANVAQFTYQIKYISNHFKIIDLNDLYNLNVRSQENYAAVTFDDGYKDNIDTALPILLKYRIPAMFFITTNFIDNNCLPWWDRVSMQVRDNGKNNLHELIQKLKHMHDLEIENYLFSLDKQIRYSNYKFDLRKPAMMSWEDLKLLVENGMTISPHTKTHCNFDIEEMSFLREEVSQSKIELEDKLGIKTFCFSYPYGFYGSRKNQIALMLKSLGIRLAVTTSMGANNIPIDNPYFLNRINMHYSVSNLKFKLLLNNAMLNIYSFIKKHFTF